MIRIIRFYLPFYVAILIGINLISFAPLGLHSPFYDTFALLFLTLGFFSFFRAVSLSLALHENSKWMYFVTGLLLGLAASIYPPLIVCWLFISLAHSSLDIEKFKYYSVGLGLGVLWLVFILSYIGLRQFVLSLSWSHIEQFAVSSKVEYALKPALVWYTAIFKSIIPLLALLLLIRLLGQKFKKNRIWQALLGVYLLVLIAGIVFIVHSSFGNGMGYTVALFLSCPFLYSYLYNHPQAKIMFRCIWTPSFISIFIVAFVSGTSGFSTVIAAFAGSLVSLIFICLVYNSWVTPRWLQTIGLVSGLLIMACAYQAANLRFFYSTAEANALPNQACFNHGPLRELCSNRQAIQFINDLEQKLQPFSGQKKTLSIISIINVGYFINDFLPLTYNAYATWGDDMVNFFDRIHHYPDIILTIKPLLPYWGSESETNSPLALQVLSQKYQLYVQDDYLSIYIKKQNFT